jgi:fido (protein-threonine AMPylation protein)
VVGKSRFERKGSNWPLIPPKINQSAWRGDLAFLSEIHRRLRQGVLDLPLEKFTPKLVFMIHGVAFHDIYHAGQIKLLRRLLDKGRRG